MSPSCANDAKHRNVRGVGRVGALPGEGTKTLCRQTMAKAAAPASPDAMDNAPPGAAEYDKPQTFRPTPTPKTSKPPEARQAEASIQNHSI